MSTSQDLSQGTTDALPSAVSCRSRNRHRHSYRRNNSTYTSTSEYLQQVSGQNDEDSCMAIEYEDLCSNLIYAEESAVTANQDVSVGSIHSESRNILDRADRSWNSIRTQIDDLCSSTDALVSDRIIAAAGSSNGSAQEPRRRRNRDSNEIGDFCDKRMRVSSTEAPVEANSATSAMRRTPSVAGCKRILAQRGLELGTLRPKRLLRLPIAGCQRPRTYRPKIRSTEHHNATPKLSTNAAVDPSLGDGLSFPLPSLYEASRVRIVEDQESFKQIAADERLAREFQGSFDSAFRAKKYDNADLLRPLKVEENSGLLIDDNIPRNSRILLQREELLATLEETLQDDLTNNFQLMQVGRDSNENDDEMLLALDDNVRRGATQATIELLPVRTISPTDVLEEVCAVCLEEPVDGAVVRCLPCMHEFHQDCIVAWLQQQAACPICKVNIDA